MADQGQGDTQPGEWDSQDMGASGPVKENKARGAMRSLRRSMRRLGSGSGSSPWKKTPESSEKADNNENGIEKERRPETQTSPVSPIRSNLFKKDGDGSEHSPQERKRLSRTLSDSSGMLGHALKQGIAIRRSLRLGKDSKESKPEKLLALLEDVSQENLPKLSVEETYDPPEIPPVPLSVMQINQMIEMKELEAAHLNLLSLRQELNRELEDNGEEASPIDLAKKEKDLKLLYSALRSKMMDIVRDSNKLPSGNQELLVHVARIIQEEEKREGGSSMSEISWRDTWRGAVLEGVQAVIGNVPLVSEDRSWLAVHLGLLGKAIRMDLENVKDELKCCYPPSFNVFNIYLENYHQAVAEHLKQILRKELELKDRYVLMEWILHSYGSEKIMGSPTLLPDMSVDNVVLPQADHILDQLKRTYCNQLQEELGTKLSNVVQLQAEDMWNVKKRPAVEDGFYHSEMHMDIGTLIKGNIKLSKNIDTDLEEKVMHVCAEQLKGFPQRFEREFQIQSEAWKNSSLRAEYQTSYINSYIVLKEQMEEYRQSSPQQVELLAKEMEAAVRRLGQCLLEQFKNQIRPYMRRMMTRKWLSSDEDFRELVRNTENLAQLCRGMKPPYVQAFVEEVHHHVVREYISQLMKNNYSCRNRKHEKAAAKMQEQWEELKEIFEELKSTSDWLYPIGEYLWKIIGQKYKRDIKNGLQPLVRDYPDISKKHISAVLYFRGLVRGRERQVILRRLVELKRVSGNAVVKGHSLFTDIPVTANRDCLASVPLFCLPSLP